MPKWVTAAWMAQQWRDGNGPRKSSAPLHRCPSPRHGSSSNAILPMLSRRIAASRSRAIPVPVPSLSGKESVDPGQACDALPPRLAPSATAGSFHTPRTEILRRTFKTLSGNAGLSKEIPDRLQNHALQDVSAKNYDFKPGTTLQQVKAAQTTSVVQQIISVEVRARELKTQKHRALRFAVPAAESKNKARRGK